MILHGQGITSRLKSKEFSLRRKKKMAEKKTQQMNFMITPSQEEFLRDIMVRGDCNKSEVIRACIALARDTLNNNPSLPTMLFVDARK
jgi:DNA replication protein DnaD